MFVLLPGGDALALSTGKALAQLLRQPQGRIMDWLRRSAKPRAVPRSSWLSSQQAREELPSSSPSPHLWQPQALLVVALKPVLVVSPRALLTLRGASLPISLNLFTCHSWLLSHPYFKNIEHLLCVPRAGAPGYRVPPPSGTLGQMEKLGSPRAQPREGSHVPKLSMA